MSKSPTSVGYALAEFIRNMVSSSNQSYWYRLLEFDDDVPETASEEIISKLQGKDETPQKCKAQLANLLKMSLQVQTGLRKAIYESLLKECGLLRIRSDKIIGISSAEFMRFMNIHSIAFELESSKVPGSPGKRWYIRLGPTDIGYHKSATIQVNELCFDPPRCLNPSLITLQRRLRISLGGITHDTNTNDSDSSSSETDCEPEDNKGEGGVIIILKC